MPVTKATHQLTRQHNRDLVLKMIFENETISRAQIARQTKLTPTTVSEVVAGLLAEGLVQEVGLGSSIGGKPSILLSLVAPSRYLIGLNLTKEKFIGSIVNLRGEIQHTVEIPVHAGEGQPPGAVQPAGDWQPAGDGQQALQQVFQILDQLVHGAWQPVMGIGVGAPGLMNTREGVIVSAVNLEWQDMPLAHLLEQRYHLPVSVLNDSQATAIGEFVYGDHASDSNLIVVTVTHGIGAGILINGQIFQGDGGGAGEIGHIVMQRDGQLCRCGRRGCLETLASARAITQLLPELSDGAQASGSLDAAVRGFFQGDPAIHQAVLQAGRYLGWALGGLVGALNIHKIVLTGDMTRFGDAWLETVRQAMLEAALGRMTRETQVEIGRLEHRACILGATAYLLLDGYSLLFISPRN